MAHWWLQNIASWLPMSRLEVLTTLFGLLSVWYYVREHIWSWPTGLVNVALAIVLYWNTKLYADAALQAIYVVLQIYGWWQWLRGGGGHSRLSITRTSGRLWLTLTAVAVLGTGAIAAVLMHWSDSTTPWPDAAITAFSLVAQWMISKKKLENWWVWISVDVMSVPLLIYKQLYLYAGLYFVFLILCLLGLLAWRRTYRSSTGA